MNVAMRCTPDTVTTLGQWLDHPEGVAIGRDGRYYAGGEDGQLYAVERDGRSQQIASTGGFVLGIAIDGEGALHVCDLKHQAVLRVGLNGSVQQRTHVEMNAPNWPAFDRHGRLFVSDSGDFWSKPGTGRVFVIHPEGRAEVFHAGPFRFANGMAISPDECWLYIAESTAARIVRVPLNVSNGPIEVTHTLPPDTVPDGIAFTEDGRLVIACFRPDALYIGEPDGAVRLLIEDRTSQLLRRPTNVAIEPGRLIIANLGGYHLTVVPFDVRPLPLHHPAIEVTA